MCDEIVVKIELRKGGGDAAQTFDFCDGILTQAEPRCSFEAVEAKVGDRRDAGVHAVDFRGVRGPVV